MRSDKISVYVNAEHIGYNGFLYKEGANITHAIDSLMKVKKMKASKAILKKVNPLKNEVAAIFSYVPDGWWKKNEIRIGVGRPGSLNFSDDIGSNYIYLHREQLLHLRKMLNIALKQKDKRLHRK